MRLSKGILCMIILPLRLLAQADTADVQPSRPASEIYKPAKRHGEKMYYIHKAIDYPVTLVVGLESIYALSVIYSKNPTSVNDINNLNKNNIPVFDRWSTKYYDPNIDRISYYPFYGVMPLPLILLFDKRIAKDKGTVGMLYLEAFAFEGFLYTSSGYLANRYRPFVYNSSLPVKDRVNGNYRNSFFAGHVAVVANATFFTAKVFNDYHPKAGIRWVLYGGAALATMGMGYLRLTAGQHFPSDIFTGALVGTACGILTPAIHKNRDFKKQKWSMSPGIFDKGETGFTFTYKL